jgi:hypothetical protein
LSWIANNSPKDYYGRETEKEVITQVKSFYYKTEHGWVLRCGEMPSKQANPEGMLPWRVASSEEDLVKKILKLQKEIGSKHKVFCHEVRKMNYGGTMLVTGQNIIIEAKRGNEYELSAMFRGRTNPEQRLVFEPTMISFKSEGKEVLTSEDIYNLHSTQRKIIWEEIGNITSPVAIEWSWYGKYNKFYVHDMHIAN